MKRKLVAIISMFLIIFLFTSCAFEQPSKPVDEAPDMLVHFIDVGQGDCILLESDNDFVLIDAGEAEYGKTVCDYLNSRQVDELDYVIASHPHSDHCGGLAKVINSFETKNFITKETDQQTSTWLNVLDAVDKADSNFIDAKVGNTYTFGNASFEILGPVSDYYEEYNNYSVIIKATCNDSSFLFTGDAEKLSENEMLKCRTDLSSDVLKVAHHGSTTSSSSQFISAVDPSFAVISCGKNNDYGHPHKEIITELKNRDITTYRTDKLGTIVASVNNDKLRFVSLDDNSVQNNEKYEFKYYIGNKNSKKFHLHSCSGAKSTKYKNKVFFFSKTEAMLRGYTACNTCNP